MNLQHEPSETDILEAAERISNYIHHTPVLQSSHFDTLIEANLFLKCENFQKVGAFKSRGAMNAVLSIDKHILQKGVATHSSGNHAQALSRAAKILHIPAYIVMPENAPRVKVAAVQGYGGQITFCKPTLESREQTLEQIVQKTGATEIHPYNNYDVIAGQATACIELIQKVPKLDFILCPVGGGGLLSGTLLSGHYFSPKTKVIGCEPEGADDASRSFKTGELIPSVQSNSIADGLLTSLGSRTFPIIKKYVHNIITVSDTQIIEAMKTVWERMKIIIEPSSAVAVAVALNHRELFKGKRIGIIITGGNVDLDKLPWMK